MARYNLRRNPGDRYDVREQHPDIVERLEKIAEQSREALGDDLQHRSGKQTRLAGRSDEK